MEDRIAKFDVGRIVVTPAASEALAASGQTLADFLARHQAGDWGDVSPNTREVNDRGLAEQFNVQSAYAFHNGCRLVVVTNAERTLTMVHLDHAVV